MHEEHQAGVAEFTGNRQALSWGEVCILETLFKIDLAAAAGKTVGYIDKGVLNKEKRTLSANQCTKGCKDNGNVTAEGSILHIVEAIA